MSDLFVPLTAAVPPHSSGELKVQRASSDPTTEPASSSTPRDSRADVSELPPPGGQALQVSPLSSLGAWPVGSAVVRRGETVPSGFASLTQRDAPSRIPREECLTSHSQEVTLHSPGCMCF
ncbi:UNVERIFIED_CONTAM: hypothetical protein FKN15_002771 [Acipenser sinensis]